jgi:hypothetical protein
VIMHRIWIDGTEFSCSDKRLQQHDDARSNPIGENVSSTVWWHDVPRGTMDEVRSYVRLDLPSDRRQGRPIDCSASFSNPMMEGPWCRFRREARACERRRHCTGG